MKNIYGHVHGTPGAKERSCGGNYAEGGVSFYPGQNTKDGKPTHMTVFVGVEEDAVSSGAEPRIAPLVCDGYGIPVFRDWPNGRKGLERRSLGKEMKVEDRGSIECEGWE